MVAAKNEDALKTLKASFKHGNVTRNTSPLCGAFRLRRAGRSRPSWAKQARPQEMSGVSSSGRTAVSHYEVTEVFRDASLVRVRIETGGPARFVRTWRTSVTRFLATRSMGVGEGRSASRSLRGRCFTHIDWHSRTRQLPGTCSGRHPSPTTCSASPLDLRGAPA